MTTSPHDALFKATFSQPAHAGPVLRSLLPGVLAEAMDWSTLELQPGSFVGPELEDRHTDLLYSVNLGGRRALIYVLWEHQSSVEPFMALRLLEYMVRIWSQLRKDHPDERALSVIVPVVLHHSDSGWTAPTRFEDLLDVGSVGLEAFGPHVIRFELIVDDIGRTTDEALRARAITALGKLVLGCLHHARDMTSLLSGLADWAAVLHEVHRAPDGGAALRIVMRYMYEVSPGSPAEIRRAVLAALPEAKEDIVTAAEQLIQSGLIKGREEGREEGRAEGQRDMLLRLMAARFGKLPEDVVSRVRSAESEAIERWAVRVLVADSPEAVLDADH